MKNKALAISTLLSIASFNVLAQDTNSEIYGITELKENDLFLMGKHKNVFNDKTSCFVVSKKDYGFLMFKDSENKQEYIHFLDQDNITAHEIIFRIDQDKAQKIKVRDKTFPFDEIFDFKNKSKIMYQINYNLFFAEKTGRVKLDLNHYKEIVANFDYTCENGTEVKPSEKLDSLSKDIATTINSLYEKQEKEKQREKQRKSLRIEKKKKEEFKKAKENMTKEEWLKTDEGLAMSFDNYIDITNKVKGKLVLPYGIKKGSECKIRITRGDDGQIKRVNKEDCVNQKFYQAAYQAIMTSSPLPVPKDKRAIKPEITIHFKYN